MKRIALFLFLILSVINCFAQTQIDPTYQIQWNLLSGSGAPSISCTQNGNYTVYPYGAEWGQSYQDTTNNVEYKCTASGWVKNLPTTGGTLTGALNGTSATFSGGVAAGTAVTAPNLVVNAKSIGAKCDGSTDDAPAINTAIASGNINLILPDGQKCMVNGTGNDPIQIVASNTWITAGTATIQALTDNGSFSQTQILSAAGTLNRTVTGSCNSGSSPTIFTLSAGSVTSADIGKSIYIAGANINAGLTDGQILFTTIAVGSSGTSVTLSDPCLTTVSGVSASIYNRLSNIQVSGGNWKTDATIARGLPPSVDFLRIDGLSVKNIGSFKATNGWVAILAEDVTDALFSNIQGMDNTAADGIHIHGPSNGVTVDGEYGTTYDDFFAITGHEWPGQYNTYGPVKNTQAFNIQGSSLTGVVAKVVAGTASTPVQNLTIRDLVGAGTSNIVMVASDAEAGGVCGVSGMLVDTVHSNIPGYIYLSCTGGNDLTIRNLYDGVSVLSHSINGITQPNTWNSVYIDGVFAKDPVPAGGGYDVFNQDQSYDVIQDFRESNVTFDCSLNISCVALSNGGTINRETLSSIHSSPSASGYGSLIHNGAGSVVGQLNTLDINLAASSSSDERMIEEAGTLTSWNGTNLQASFPGTVQGYIFYADGSAIVGSYSVANASMNKGVSTIYQETGSSVGPGIWNGLTLTGTNRLGNFYSNADLTLNGTKLGTLVNLAIYTSGGAITVRGSGVSASGNQIQRAGSEVIHVINPDFPADLSLLTGAIGDRAFNTNSGAGPLTTSVYSGSAWVALPSNLTGYHGTSGTKVQLSDGTGPSGNYAKFASDGSITDGGTGGTGTVSGQANGVVPLATASTVIGAQSHLSDNGTTMSYS